ncbi:MAG: 16S rRNA (uracil(1498)-N(3))-methyltransferase [Bacteroidetes bacterium]|jgi:16S rRNA (uracil1498-N3)-methyltransferase|nr:16S rRNA (uracil(1498)-N(3))-methyltransferase [Bacteroidota bacterium]
MSALPYFFEPSIEASITHFALSELTSKHCIQVLRMRAGESLHLTDGVGNLYTASIVEPDKKNTVVKIDTVVHTPRPQKNVCIAIGLLKNTGRFEWFLEKATEMGVTKIVPLICERSERSNLKQDRMQGVLVAALIQSKQTWLPVLTEPLTVAAFIKEHPSEQKLIAHCEESNKTELKDIANSNDTSILIGPEGDFTPTEIETALSANYSPVSLGSTRLRTETAGMVAAALLIYKN